MDVADVFCTQQLILKRPPFRQVSHGLTSLQVLTSHYCCEEETSHVLVSHPWTPSRKHTKQRMHNMLICSYCMYYTTSKTSVKISAYIGIKNNVFHDVPKWKKKLLGIYMATDLKSNHRIIVIRNCKDFDAIHSSFSPAHMCSLQYFASFYGLGKIIILFNSLGSEGALCQARHAFMFSLECIFIS